jgi:hypothetical protein
MSQGFFPFNDIDKLLCERSVEVIPDILIIWIDGKGVMRALSIQCHPVHQILEVCLYPLIDCWASDQADASEGSKVGVVHGTMASVHLMVEIELMAEACKVVSIPSEPGRRHAN